MSRSEESSNARAHKDCCSLPAEEHGEFHRDKTSSPDIQQTALDAVCCNTSCEFGVRLSNTFLKTNYFISFSMVYDSISGMYSK